MPADAASGTGRADQRALIQEELADLDDQVASGEIDEETAAVLRTRYEGELQGLGEAASAEEVPAGGETPRPRRAVSGRVLAGAALIGIAIVAIGVLAVVSLRDGSAGAEGVADAVIEGETVTDLDDVSNEQLEAVVAANPDVIGMRLALARRYFEEGSFDKALDHYFEVLDREQHPEALTNIGWMTHLSNRSDIAIEYLDAALQRRPDYLPATWFKANVLIALDRSGEAIPLLVDVAGSQDVPDVIRDDAVILLEQLGTSE